MNICIIVNRDKDKDLIISKKVCKLFEDNDSHCFICEQEDCGVEAHFTDPDKLPDNIDCIMTIGGDGTLIQAARDLHGKNIPIIGVNMGTLGFLAELDINSIPDAVARLCSGDYYIEDHMMLHGRIYRNGECIYKNFALNDAVISKYGHYHVICFDVFVDDQLLSDYSADGLIISTPTGSTAYNLSAGGPLILPNASMMVLTPICAHTLYSRSICLPESSCIKIRIKNKSVDGNFGCAVTFDGADSIQLQSGDEVILEKSETSTRLLKLDYMSFIKVLQKKMS